MINYVLLCQVLDSTWIHRWLVHTKWIGLSGFLDCENFRKFEIELRWRGFAKAQRPFRSMGKVKTGCERGDVGWMT